MDIRSAIRGLFVSSVVAAFIFFLTVGIPALRPFGRWAFDSIEGLSLSAGVRSHIVAVMSIGIERLVASVGVALLVINIRAIWKFVSRTLLPTDKLIVGPWYVYRYTVGRGTPKLLTDRWTIRRNFKSEYVVSMEPLGNHKLHEYRGKVLLNERDRLGILLEGISHKETSMIFFSPTIPSDGDSRILGLGVGDDADYVTSSRIYLASRTKLPSDHALSVIDCSTRLVKEQCNGPLLQLTEKLISETLKENPLLPITVEKLEGDLWRKALDWFVAVLKFEPGTRRA